MSENYIMTDYGSENAIINKIISTKSMRGVIDFSIDDKFFTTYSDLFRFITTHYETYNVVPDKSTIATKFPDFEFMEVYESDKYLADQLYKQYKSRTMFEVVMQNQELVHDNPQQFADILDAKITQLNSVKYDNCYNWVETKERYDEYLNSINAKDDLFIKTGFDALDDIIGGWKKEEIAILLARPNQGKSWILDKFALSSWNQNKRVGIYSGEMSKLDVSYRLDTLDSHISNTCLQRGNAFVKEKYTDYTGFVSKQENPIFITTQKEYGGRPTVAKLKNFIESEQLDILFVDQLSLVLPTNKSKDRRLQYEEIMQEFLDVTMKLQVPIICACQANRKTNEDPDDKMPRIENIAESDAIGQVATRVIAMCQDKNTEQLVLKVAKNRNMALGEEIYYKWKIDTGEFEFNSEGKIEKTKEVVTQNSRRKGNIF